MSGQELAGCTQIQAQKFGATLALPMQVAGIVGDKPPYEIQVVGGANVSARSIVIASGATYRTLGLSNDRQYEGRSIHYAAIAIEAGLCDGDQVVVVGGGNSAGQAAIFLAGRTKHVHLLVRRDGLSETMSYYLSRRIEASSKIILHNETEITALAGEPALSNRRSISVDFRSAKEPQLSQSERRLSASN